MIKRLIAALNTIVLLVTPGLTLAAFETPSSLFAALYSTQKTAQTSAQINGRLHNYYFAMWISGESQKNGMQGLLPLLTDAKSQTKITFDVQGPDGKLRMRMQMRQINEKIYLMIDSIEGSYSDDIVKMTGTFALKKWISFDLSQMLDELGGIQDMMLSGSSAESLFAAFDEFLDINSTDTRTGLTSYTLTLKRSVLRELLPELRKLQIGEIKDEYRYIRPSLSLTMKVDTVKPAGDIQFMKVDGEVNHPGFSVVLSQKTTYRAAPPVITEPKDAVDVETLMDSFSKAFSTPGLNYNPESFLPYLEKAGSKAVGLININ